jgi:ABC-2 type transport system permease protein
MSGPDAPAGPGAPAAASVVVPAAESASGSIYDLGYRNYDGPRLGRPHAIRALFMHTLKVCYGIGRGGRAKLAPIILAGMATIPAVVAVGALALLRQAGLPGDAQDASPIDHDTYYGVITTLVILFCAAQVPEAMGRDQRHSLLALYFSRALRRMDYALSRFAGVTAAIFLFVLLPQTVIFVGLILSAEDVGAEVAAEVAFLPAILGQGALLALVLGGVSAVISAFTPRRAYATVAIIVVLSVTPFISPLLIELGTRGLATVLALLSPVDILDATNAWLFDSFPESEAVRQSDLSLEMFVVAALVLAAACLAILVWRYRKITA